MSPNVGVISPGSPVRGAHGVSGEPAGMGTTSHCRIVALSHRIVTSSHGHIVASNLLAWLAVAYIIHPGGSRQHGTDGRPSQSAGQLSHSSRQNGFLFRDAEDDTGAVGSFCCSCPRREHSMAATH